MALATMGGLIGIASGLLKTLGGVLVGKVAEEGGEIISKKMKEFVGGTEAAKHDTDDEALFCLVKYSLQNYTELTSFTAQLRKEDPKKAEAFVLFIAKMLHLFERDMKVSPQKNNKKKEKVEEKEITSFSYKDYSIGIKNAQNFLSELLEIRGCNKEETFRKRVEFLEGENVFSLITPPKEDSPAIKKFKEIGESEFVRNGKELPVKVLENIKKAGKATGEKITETTRKVREAQGKNLANLTEETSSWIEKTKKWRDASPKRRK